MNQTTLHGIKALLMVDQTVTEEQTKDILRHCRNQDPRTYINARRACEILGVSRPTLREYVKRGHIQQYNLSCRKVRFDATDLCRFADSGITPVGGAHV